MQCKMDMYFSFDFGCLLRTGRWDFFLLNEENL